MSIQEILKNNGYILNVVETSLIDLCTCEYVKYYTIKSEKSNTREESIHIYKLIDDLFDGTVKHGYPVVYAVNTKDKEIYECIFVLSVLFKKFDRYTFVYDMTIPGFIRLFKTEFVAFSDKKDVEKYLYENGENIKEYNILNSKNYEEYLMKKNLNKQTE